MFAVQNWKKGRVWGWEWGERGCFFVLIFNSNQCVFLCLQYKIEKKEESEDEEEEDDDNFMSTKKKDEVPDDPMARKWHPPF